MLSAESVEDLLRRPGATRLRVRQTALNALDGLHTVEQPLVRAHILDQEFSLAVHGQGERMTSLSGGG